MQSIKATISSSHHQYAPLRHNNWMFLFLIFVHILVLLYKTKVHRDYSWEFCHYGFFSPYPIEFFVHWKDNITYIFVQCDAFQHNHVYTLSICYVPPIVKIIIIILLLLYSLAFFKGLFSSFFSVFIDKCSHFKILC